MSIMEIFRNKKILGGALFFICLVSFSFSNEEWKSAERDFLLKYAAGGFDSAIYEKLKASDGKSAEILKARAEKLEIYFNDVIKSEKPLVPKQCRYLILFDLGRMNGKDKNKIIKAVALCTLANMDTSGMHLLIADAENEEELLKLTKSTGVSEEKIEVYKNEGDFDAIEWAISKIKEDLPEKNSGQKRVLLLTKASSARKNYASFLRLEDSGDIKLESFVVLDIPRREVEKKSKKEREEAFMALSMGK